MKTPSPLTPVLAALLAAVPLAASNYVADSLNFTVVRDYADGPNAVDESVTSDSNPNQISYTTFVAEVAQAFDNGLGGVIDFENGRRERVLWATDKTLVNAYATERQEAEGFVNPVEYYRFEALDDLTIGSADDPYFGGPLDALDGEDEAFRYDSGDPANTIFVPAPVDGYTFTDPPDSGEILATEVIETGSGLPGFHLVDDERMRLVENRFDRSRFSDWQMPINDDLSPRLFASIVGRFGSDGSNTVTVRRGPLHIEELSLASQTNPGTRSGEPINDEFYLATRQENSTVSAVSGTSLLGGGGAGTATAKDLLFDPRERIVALGFTLPNITNFQYYQGPSATSDNPDNIIVTASFSDGSIAEFRGTTQQTTAGGNDQFYGIRAPVDESITRLQVRVVGRNYRTFTNIDDIGFITETSAPFIRDGADAEGLTGREFCHRIDIARQATSIDIPDLPTGLTFDSDTGLVTGVPSTSGVHTSDIIMTNEAGSRTETVTFSFVDPDPGVSPPVLYASDALAVVDRPFAYAIGSSEPILDSFAVVHRLPENGAPVRTYLDQLGFDLELGAISGTPARSDQVGEYSVEFYVKTAGGCASDSFTLRIIPPVIEPDFNADGATDWILFDESTGTLSGALGTSFITADGYGEFPASGPPSATLISGLPSNAAWELIDLDDDGSTDIVTFEPATSTLGIHYVNGLTVDALPPLTFAPEGTWQLAAVDTGRIVLKNLAGDSFEFWEVSGRVSLTNVTPSAMYQPGAGWPAASLVAWADFDGDFQKEALLFYGAGEYAFAEFAVEPGEPFRIEDGLAVAGIADINSDGVADILWKSETGGFFAVWFMGGAADVPEGLRQASGSGLDNALAGPDRIFRDPSVYDISLSGDFNGDGRLDLAFVDPSTGDRELIFQPAGPQPDFMEDGVTPRPKQLRDDVDGTQILQTNASKTLLDNFPVPGQLPLALQPDEALIDYQIYEQRKDGNGNRLWTIVGFHAIPVADTAKPLASRDVFFDGMHSLGEALASYEIFQRDGDDAQGRPKVLVSGGFIPLPQLKRVDKPVVDPGTEDYAWTPVNASEPGVDFDARGRRGFLVERDLYGLPRLDEFGQPLYKLWQNSFGQTVEGVPGSQPYELDYITGEPETVLVSDASTEWVSTGDFDGDGRVEIVSFNQTSGFYEIIPGDEIGLPLLTRWLRRQFGDENAPIADLALDPDFDGCSTLIEYAMGVDDVYLERPETMWLEAGAGGNMLARFPWRVGDGTLLVDVEYLDVSGSWAVTDFSLMETNWRSANTAEVLLETGVPLSTDPVLMRLQVGTE
jgi:hypothetical protein